MKDSSSVYCLSLCGTAIALAAMFAPNLKGEAIFAAFGVAGTALGGAAGLARSAQPQKVEADTVETLNMDSKK